MKLKKIALLIMSLIITVVLLNISGDKIVHAENDSKNVVSIKPVSPEAEPNASSENSFSQKPVEITEEKYSKADTSKGKKSKDNTKKTSGSQKVNIPAYTPSATYKPIVGKRVVYSYKSYNANKELLYKEIRKIKDEIEKIDLSINQKSNYLNALQSLIDKTAQKESYLFIEKEQESDDLAELSRFDKSLKPYSSYSLVTGAEGLLEAYNTYISNKGNSDEADTENFTNASSLSPDNMVNSNKSIYVIRYMNVGAIDIGEYLDYSYEIQNYSMHKLYENREKKLKTLEKLYKKYQAVSIGDVVFNPKDVTEVSNINEKQMTYILKGTNLEQFADTYVQIEKDYGINAIAICSLSAHESNWGKSRRAIQDHNYTGFGVYSDSSVGINTATGEENLIMTANHLANNYVIPGSKYYNGKGLDGINKKYAASRTWAFGIESIGYRLMDRLKTYKQ